MDYTHEWAGSDLCDLVDSCIRKDWVHPDSARFWKLVPFKGRMVYQICEPNDTDPTKVEKRYEEFSIEEKPPERILRNVIMSKLITCKIVPKTKDVIEIDQFENMT